MRRAALASFVRVVTVLVVAAGTAAAQEVPGPPAVADPDTE
jgi:hypothetical protein